MRKEKYLERRNLRQMMWKYLVEVDSNELRDDELHPHVGEPLY